MNKNTKLYDPRIEQILKFPIKKRLLALPIRRLTVLLLLSVAIYVMPTLQRIGGYCIALMLGWLLLYLRQYYILRRYRKRIEHLFFEEELRNDFKQRYPKLTEGQLRLVIRGFKDYLIQCLIEKPDLPVPSQAVSCLCQVLIKSHQDYARDLQYVVGFLPKFQALHSLEVTADSLDQQCISKRQELEKIKVWRCYCRLHGWQPLRTQQHPRLFLIDQTLRWDATELDNIYIYQKKYQYYKKLKLL